ncbi:MAG: NYN domain-containing protein [Phycisphaerae bacterium]|jgi:predicted RNA-binding protein with PIN domain
MYIIDGYNLLWSVRKAAEHLEEMSESQLCQFIGIYLRAIGSEGQIVFDGIGPPDKTLLNSGTGIDIVFSGPGIDADTYIEAKIKADSAPKRLTVVSTDRQIRRAASARKAVSVRSEKFWQDVVKTLNKKIKAPEPIEKKRGLDEGQTMQWLKYFGFDQ